MSTSSAIISGTGMSVPDRVVTNKDLEKIVDTSDEWITTRTGIRERRIAGEGEKVSTFCIKAARDAMDAAGVTPLEIQMIIVATVTPDQPIPATACIIQKALGCTNAAAFDMQAGCSGFIYAQSVAKQFVVSGRCKHVLVIGAELLSKFLNWEDRATCVIFADGAGAVVMSEGELPRGVLSSAMYTDGGMADFITLPAGGSAMPPSAETVEKGLHFIQMKGNETFKMAVRSIAGVCLEVLENAGLTPDDVTWFIPHQANQRIIGAVGNRLGITDERCYVNIDRFGNTSAASIPIALDEIVRAGKVKEGDILLMAAFGAGLTWAGSVVRW
ncbi:MAG: ketoacyl-ACP synthase III [Acidobacteria bacterium]|uniref:Beta-ketoacyl-[acyl-carrier-protein] synthase III n=1 Tax=Candidatus Polarisedimenticola svalbardensis TaxID=2886004 RepID=A0A8J7CDE7_9BACT|nr:ketoacyl-ACP synthase III [Candidatus Polarisedimenticola svalbardensis]